MQPLDDDSDTPTITTPPNPDTPPTRHREMSAKRKRKHLSAMEERERRRVAAKRLRRPPAREAPKCPACAGYGRVDAPDIGSISLSKLARTAGVSVSLLSRMFALSASQPRANPTLETMRRVCAAVEKETGTRMPLDVLAKAIGS